MKTAQNNLKELINLRTESVLKQLNNEKSNIHTDMDLDSIGGFHSVYYNKWNKMIK